VASLVARHSRTSELRSRTTALDPAGCTCVPSLYVVHRHDGRLIRMRVGRDRKRADLQLTKLKVKVAEDLDRRGA
jgi:hypothetical protein